MQGWGSQSYLTPDFLEGNHYSFNIMYAVPSSIFTGVLIWLKKFSLLSHPTLLLLLCYKIFFFPHKCALHFANAFSAFIDLILFFFPLSCLYGELNWCSNVKGKDKLFRDKPTWSYNIIYFFLYIVGLNLLIFC